MPRALFFQANVPIQFWGEYVLIAGYLINRIPDVVLKGKATFEFLFHKSPSFSHIKSFGCLAYVHDHGFPKDKFQSRGRKCVFFGISIWEKRLEFFYLQAHEFLTSQDVVFIVHEFPYLTISSAMPKAPLEVNFGELPLGPSRPHHPLPRSSSPISASTSRLV